MLLSIQLQTHLTTLLTVRDRVVDVAAPRRATSAAS